MKKQFAHRVIITDTDGRSRMIERHDDVTSIETLLKQVLTWIALAVIGGLFFLILLISFFGGCS